MSSALETSSNCARIWNSNICARFIMGGGGGDLHNKRMSNKCRRWIHVQLKHPHADAPWKEKWGKLSRFCSVRLLPDDCLQPLDAPTGCVWGKLDVCHFAMGSWLKSLQCVGGGDNMNTRVIISKIILYSYSAGLGRFCREGGKSCK